jgi:hypothetical protein
VTIVIVDGFEVVQVKKHQRTINRVAPVGHDRLAQPVIEQASVGQTGQVVVKRELAYFVFKSLALGHIADRHVDGGDTIELNGSACTSTSITEPSTWRNLASAMGSRLSPRSI